MLLCKASTSTHIFEYNNCANFSINSIINTKLKLVNIIRCQIAKCKTLRLLFYTSQKNGKKKYNLFQFSDAIDTYKVENLNQFNKFNLLLRSKQKIKNGNNNLYNHKIKAYSNDYWKWQRKSAFKAIFTAFLLLLVLIGQTKAQTFRKVHLGFPEAWDGDKYPELFCPSKNIPKFLDGYFLCQLSAAYGKRKSPAGQRLNHMIDAIGAVGSFQISNGQVSFSAQYYPSRPYKIWEFYDRNMSQASVPWVGWSDYNLTAMDKWERISNNPNSARFHPNLDFWKVGKKVIAGTEAPYWIGYEFDVKTLGKFKLFPLTEENEIFGNPQPNLIPISMAIHERMDPSDGILWGTFSAMNYNEHRFFQGIFTVDPNGKRRVVGMYDYGVWDVDACNRNDDYIGDKTPLPGYIHSITSTENYIILPITSLLINPCKFKEPPIVNPNSIIQKGGLWGMDFYNIVPMRFLIFDKRTNLWVTQKPLEVFPSMFITHQLNAFETLQNGNVINADMIVYDNHDPYVKYFYTDFLTSQVYPNTARIVRFTLDLQEYKVMYNYLVPEETIAADFPQVNHAYDGKTYEWAYILEHPFAASNAILKINVENISGQQNLKFQPADTNAQIVLHEPWFVARPSPVSEDDGVLIVRALDLDENKGLLLVIDAISMVEIGRAYVPISVPFGFHNRYFSRIELGYPMEFESSVVNSKKPEKLTWKPDSYSSINDISTASRKQVFRPNTWKRRFSHTQFWSRIRSTTTSIPSPSWIPIQATTSSTILNWSLRTTSKKPYELYWKTTTALTSPSFSRLQELIKTLPASGPEPLPFYHTNNYASLSHYLGLNRPNRIRNLRSNELVLLPEEGKPASLVKPAKITIVGGGNELVKSLGKKSVSLGQFTIREIYNKTFRTLCKWLPKLFPNISIDKCIDSVLRSSRYKWIAPKINDFSSENESNIFSPNSYYYERQNNNKATVYNTPYVLRPVLKGMTTSKAQISEPWYNFRTISTDRKDRRTLL